MLEGNDRLFADNILGHFAFGPIFSRSLSEGRRTEKEPEKSTYLHAHTDTQLHMVVIKFRVNCHTQTYSTSTVSLLAAATKREIVFPLVPLMKSSTFQVLPPPVSLCWCPLGCKNLHTVLFCFPAKLLNSMGLTPMCVGRWDAGSPLLYFGVFVDNSFMLM